MLGKSGRKIILYKYIWSFSVYVYTHPPDAKLTQGKTYMNSDKPIRFFQKKFIFLHYSLRQTKYHKINWIWRLGMIWLFKVVSTTFLLVCFLSLNESTCQTRKNAFYFTSKALFVLEKTNLSILDFQISWCHQMPKHKTRNTFCWITWGVNTVC